MSQVNRWKERKNFGQFQPRSELSSHQQTLLAAVPKWKLEWVRPSSLKPHQSPKYLVKKWVIDTSEERVSGTDEEMAAALKQVVENHVTLGGMGSASGSVTPAVVDDPEPASTKRKREIIDEARGDVGESAGVSLSASAEASGASTPLPLLPPVPSNPSKPSAGPASSPDLSLPPAGVAVAALQDLPPIEPITADVGMEDEVQLAGEALAGTIA